MASDPIVLSNSKIKLYKKCSQAYYYKEVDGIVPKRPSLPLQRGIIIHSGLEAYYNLEDPHDAIDKYLPFWYDLMDEEKELYGGNLMEECHRIMDAYIDQYGPTPVENVLEVELDFSEEPVEILPGIHFKGVIDAILEDTEDHPGIWITEHKTHKKFPTEGQRFFDPQTIIYYLVVKQLMDIEPMGVMWNYIKTKPPTVPRLLKNGGLSRATSIQTDRNTYMKAILENGLDPEDYSAELELFSQNKFFERIYMPFNKSVISGMQEDITRVAHIMNRLAKYPIRNMNQFNCMGCDYKQLCQAEFLGLDTEFIRKKDFKPKESRKGQKDAYYSEDSET